MIRVLVADDNAFMRKVLKELIEVDSDCVVAGQAETAEETLKLTQSEKFDVLLIDISFEGDEGGIQLISRLRESGVTAPILTISLHDEFLYAERLRQAGAQGYVMKYHAAEKILPAIHEVVSGQTYWSV